MSSSTFHSFTDLPLELRLNIYAHSLPPSRLVRLRYFSPTTDLHIHQGKPFRGCTSTASIPSLLHLSSEARTLATDHYKLSFNLAGPPGSFPAKVWFDPSCDILFFDLIDGELTHGFKNFLHCLTMVDRKELAKIRRLAVHVGLFVEDCGSEVVEGSRSKSAASDSAEYRRLKDFWEYVRSKFYGVEEVLFVCAGGEDNVFSDLHTKCTGVMENKLDEGYVQAITDGKDMSGLCDETFQEKAERVLRTLQSQRVRGSPDAWKVPRWCVVKGSKDQAMDIGGGVVAYT